MKKILSPKMHPITLPIFPLSVFVLPEGKVRLRIYEVKYLKMLSLISSHQKFIIQLSTSSSVLDKNNWGSLVEIQDFNQGEDGILEIDVKCLSLVLLSDIEQDKNHIAFAKVEPFGHWSQDHVNENMSSPELSAALNDLMSNDATLNQLYPNRSLKNDHWVVARWIELLPVNLTIKNLFVSVSNFSQAKDFVNSVIYK